MIPMSSRSPASSSADRKAMVSRNIPASTPETETQSAPPESLRSQPGSRLITLVHYKQILTALQLMADTVTIVLSFLAGYALWS
jgi:hypothetical protein